MKTLHLTMGHNATIISFNMSEPDDIRCEQIKPNGERCKAKKVKDSHFCCFHDPHTKEITARGRKRGGIKRSLERGDYIVPEFMNESDIGAPPETPQDVLTLLSKTTHAVAIGKCDPKRAEAVSKMAKLVLQFHETIKPEKKIEMTDEELETALQEQLGNVRARLRSKRVKPVDDINPLFKEQSATEVK